MSKRRRRRAQFGPKPGARLPCIGPCRCPLRLWWLAYLPRSGAHADAGRVALRYFADRAEAREWLARVRAGTTGWPELTGKTEGS